MKRLCALFITFFYLSLSTGAYACLLHCATGYLAVQLEKNEHARITGNHPEHDEPESDEDCSTGDCNCCYHHGTYVVKENAKISTHFVILPTDIAIVLFHTENFFYIPLKITTKVSWPRPTGPPFLNSEPIYISNKALLI